MPRRPISLQSGDSAQLRPEPRLLKAVEANDLVKVKNVIEDAQAERQISRNLLSIGLNRACERGYTDVAKFLLKRGANPDWVSGNKQPALLRAAECGLVQVAETLIDGNAHLEIQDKKGRTALMTAAWKGHGAIVQLLLTRGAYVDTVDFRRRNVLHNVAADAGDKNIPKSSHPPHRKCDMDIVEYLLQAGVNLDAEDELGRTALHWACVTDNEPLVRLLLTTRFGGASPLPRVNATDKRMKSPLQLAAFHNREHLARVLLEHGADVQARSDGGWTALHNAAQSGSRPLVQALIDVGAAVNRELLNGRTPLHVAAEYGNIEAAECLLEHAHTKRSVKDRFGNTPLLIAAQRDDRKDRHGKPLQSAAVQQGKKQILEMLAPWNHVDELSHDEILAAKRFDATIVDFGDFRNDNRVQRRSVYELLYARDIKDASKHSISTLPKKVKSTHFPPFRWIHLPVNNIAWCDALLTKRFIEEGATDVEGYKALETSFNHQHRGQQHHSRFMRPMCQVVHRTENEYDDPESSGPEAIVEEPEDVLHFSRVTINGSRDHTKRHGSVARQTELPAVAGAASPEATPSTSQTKAKGRKAQKQGSHDTNTTLTASEASVDNLNGLSTKLQFRRQETTSTAATSEPVGKKKAIKPSSTPTKTPKDTRRHGPKQGSRAGTDKFGTSTPKRSQNACNIFMFMPYLHFETDRRRREMQRAMEDPEKLNPEALMTVADEVLIRAHLTKSASFLHVRRTLDQFFYHNIDTSYRDCDQVVYRFQQKHHKENVDPKIFMVDQLWMWILGKDLVVTSFPQRWRQPRNDPLNVLEGIIEDINSKTREPCQDVYDLAMTIAGRCFGTFDRHRKGDDDFQFFDMFESSIGAAMDNEATLFQDFSKASRQASDWLKSHQQPNRLSKTLEAESRKFEHDVKNHPDRVEQEDYNDRSPQFVDKLLDVGAETDLLSEIKDIRDELDIIRMVLGHQEHLLPEFREAVKGVYNVDRSYARVRKAEKLFDEHEKTITNPIKDIGRMETQADRVYESIRSLLDLKQKHANAFEARFARDQAAGTQRQGQTIMVFTIVTVIFLPLSFITAFFAINVKEFPHPSGLGSQAEMPLAYVCAYIFGIGFAITVPAIAVALSVDEISHFITTTKARSRKVWHKLKGKKHPDSEREIEALKIGHTLSMAKSLRRSVDVNWQGKASSPPPRRSIDSGWEVASLRRASRPEPDLERGRRNARTDTF